MLRGLLACLSRAQERELLDNTLAVIAGLTRNPNENTAFIDEIADQVRNDDVFVPCWLVGF
jgi:hypothetical protein